MIVAHFGKTIEARRGRNAKALAAFGVQAAVGTSGLYRTIREGSGPVLYTIGYEKRDGEDLVSRLLDAGVDVLVDVRERPMSRKPDFRRSALEASCEEAGIEYQSWTSLGSTDHQRTQLRETNDFSTFRNRFRSFAKRGRVQELDDLAHLATKKCIALICYERQHEECHRSILAELLGDRVDASVVAIT